MIDAVVDDRDLRLRQPKKSNDIGCGAVADGHNLVLTAGEVLDHKFSVEHSERVVLASDLKRRQIVNCGNQRTWFAPEQSTVTWHVQHIEFESGNRSWQAKL